MYRTLLGHPKNALRMVHTNCKNQEWLFIYRTECVQNQTTMLEHPKNALQISIVSSQDYSCITNTQDFNNAV